MAHENINVRELPPEGASVIADREEYNGESNVLVSQRRYNTLLKNAHVRKIELVS